MPALLTDLSVKARLGLLLGALVLYLGAGNRIEAANRNPDRSRPGINLLRFEMAWTPATIRSLITAWQPDAVSRLRRGLLWDFGLIPAYVLGLILLTGFVATGLVTFAPDAAHFGTELGYVVLIAGALDVIEDIALLRVLVDTSAPGWVLAASIASALKWACILTTGIYLLAEGVNLGWHAIASRAR